MTSETKQPGGASEAEARAVAEAAREQTWEKPSFSKELFLGRLRMDLIDPFPVEPAAARAECDAFLEKLKPFLVAKVDGERIDREGEVPADVIAGLKEIGAFGLTIPKEYGGLGLTKSSYNRIIEMVAAHCANTATLLSAHQSIGVPQPLKLFGTDEQKKRYLPRLARGEISAFALTEHGAGSDPANMTTRAELSADGSHWILNGEKLWCTNGTIADLLVVMAQTPPKVAPDGSQKKQISAFIVERSWPGVEVAHRCHFSGLRGIYNGVLRFKDVKVPRENLLWKEGAGLKLALVTLNTGRLTLPSCVVGGMKQALSMARRFAATRFQWGVTIGKHDEVAGKITDLASTLFAMQALADLGCLLVDQGGHDVRLEAAIAKLFNTEHGVRLAGECFQVRGGRGYETEQSLKARGEIPYPVERLLRDFRINTVVEGSTQVMHLFIAREALDAHVTAAGALLDPKSSFGAKAKSFWNATKFYAGWVPKLLVGAGMNPMAYAEYGALAGHVRWIERSARRLARAIFACMMRHTAKLERRQRLLARVVDIGAELTAMAAACARARTIANGPERSSKAIDLASSFCRAARRRVDELFRQLGSNDDVASYQLAQSIVAGDHAWLEQGVLDCHELLTKPK
ncbi:MAG: acyl-CoA dehydrogenase family protein [Planctomycetes bacterium]|nr:acyl-CoA dehydrogenase family protein [Planctomycetota bacterium]